MPVEAFHSYEPAQYRLPARGEITRGEEVDNPNDRVDSTLKTEQWNRKFEWTKNTILEINSKEAQDKNTDHPTPEEILAELNNAFLWPTNKPKNSDEGWAQAVEWSIKNKELNN